jgi:pheromone receptor transcription factor
MSNVAPANQGGSSHAHGHVGQQPIINFQHEDGDEDGEDDDDDAPKSKAADKKSGRRKIKIEFINDKSRRHITFSKRKAGIMKKVSPRSETPDPAIQPLPGTL